MSYCVCDDLPLTNFANSYYIEEDKWPVVDFKEKEWLDDNGDVVIHDFCTDKRSTRNQ